MHEHDKILPCLYEGKATSLSTIRLESWGLDHSAGIDDDDRERYSFAVRQHVLDRLGIAIGVLCIRVSCLVISFRLVVSLLSDL